MQHHLGIIGFGGMAEYHYNTARREDIGMQAVAVFDVREERRNRAVELGMRAYDNVEDFFADGGFDFVLVATPNNHHCRYVCMAMEHGFNVMCEKPAAMNVAEVEKMIEVSEKTGKFWTIHQNRRFDHDFRLIKKTMDSGVLGKPFIIESHCHCSGSGCMYNWRGMEDHGGGMFRDWGVHMLDQLLFYIDKDPVTVYANVIRIRSEEVDDFTKLVMTFDDGLVAQMDVATYAPLAMHRWAVYGDRGAATIDNFDSQTAKVRRIKSDKWHDNPAPAYVGENDWGIRHQNVYDVTEFEAFEVGSEGIIDDWGMIYKNIIGVLDGREELFVKPCQVLRVMKVIEAAFQSSETHQAIQYK